MMFDDDGDEICVNCGRPHAAHPEAIANAAVEGFSDPATGIQYRWNAERGGWERRRLAGSTLNAGPDYDDDGDDEPLRLPGPALPTTNTADLGYADDDLLPESRYDDGRGVRRDRPRLGYRPGEDDEPLISPVLNFGPPPRSALAGDRDGPLVPPALFADLSR